MQSSTAAYLQVPVSVALERSTMRASLSIPRTATALSVCIEHPGQEQEHRDLVGRLAAIDVAALTVRSFGQLSLTDMVTLIDWVRSRRLLRSLPIALITPGSEGAVALKAAQHRSVAVPAVLVMHSDSKAMPSALRWLRARLSARPKADCHLSVAYSA
jgi:hypothetical protein